MQREVIRDLELVLLQVVLELARAGWMAQLAQRLGLDLPDALARHAEFLAHLFQRVALAVKQPKAHLQHLPLPFAERVEDILHLLLE